MSGGNREWEGVMPERIMPAMVLVYVSEVEKVIGRKLTFQDIDNGIVLAAAPTLPAQEDEPVAYEIYDATRKPCSWVSVSKEKYLELTSIGWNGRTLYTRPDHDNLRKAAEEARAIFNDIDQQMNRIMDNLRAALEG